MTKLYTIELDIAHDYYNTPDYINDLVETGVTDELIALEGPAGGNPLVAFTGTLSQVSKLVELYDYDLSDFIEL